MTIESDIKLNQRNFLLFLQNDYPSLINSIRAGDVANVKKIFEVLAEQGITWQKLDHAFAILNDQKPALYYRRWDFTDLFSETTLETFSQHLLAQTAVSGNIPLFQYLHEALSIPLTQAQAGKVLLFDAWHFNHIDFIDYLLALPDFKIDPIHQSFLYFFASAKNQIDFAHRFFALFESSIGDREAFIAITNQNALVCQRVLGSEDEKNKKIIAARLEALQHFQALLSKDDWQKPAWMNVALLKSALQDQLAHNYRTDIVFRTQLKLAIKHFNLHLFEPTLLKVLFQDAKVLANHIQHGSLSQIKDFLADWQLQNMGYEKLDDHIFSLSSSANCLIKAMLGQAVESSNIEMLDYLLQVKKLPLSQKNMTIVMLALTDEHAKVVDYLLNNKEFGANITMALNLAIYNNHPQITKKIKWHIIQKKLMPIARVQELVKSFESSKLQSDILRHNTSKAELKLITSARNHLRELQTLLQSIEMDAAMQNYFQQLLEEFSVLKNGKLQPRLMIMMDDIRKELLSNLLLNALRYRKYDFATTNHTILESAILATQKISFLYSQQNLMQIQQALTEEFHDNMQDILEKEALDSAKEDSMNKPDAEDIGLYQEIQNQYHEKFNAQGGANAILADFQLYLEEKFLENNLSREYDSAWSKETLQQYYSNIYHSAWRYLFLSEGNPWLAENPRQAKKSAIVFEKERTMIAYFWLAASDHTASCTNDVSIDDRKDHLIRELAYLNREYNWVDTQVNDQGETQCSDNGEGDDPSCAGGVKKRVYQLLFGHPIVEDVKPLTPEIMVNLIKTHLIAESPQGSTLFDRLNRLADEEIASLKMALEDWIINLEDVSKQSKIVLKSLSVDTADFVKVMLESFGEARLAKLKIHYQLENFCNYFYLINAMAKSPVKYFGDIILTKVNSMIKDRATLDASSPIVHAFKESGTKRTRDVLPRKSKENAIKKMKGMR